MGIFCQLIYIYSITNDDLGTKDHFDQMLFKHSLIEMLSNKPNRKSELRLKNVGSSIGIANDVSSLSRACSIQ